MFRFYLNNNQVEDPINWAEFTEVIERNNEIRGIIPKYEQQLTFSGSGYKYLSDLFNQSGFCNLIEIKVEQKCSGGGYETILNGYIFLSECKFNLNKCSVECGVQDNNFAARVYNNKSIEIYLDSSLSKNGTSIDACENKSVTFFRPSTGADVVGTRKCYPTWSVFKYFVDFMSDGLIDFESDYLDYTQTQTDNPQRRLTITTGAILRTFDTVSPKLSFDTIFEEFARKYPIAFTIIKQANGRPLIKVENEDYFFGSGSGIKINKVQDLLQSINSEMLYSEIAIGGTTATYNASIHSVPGDRRMFFKTENYYFQTECNIDKRLDLVGTFICDSNIIEELVFTNTSNNSYDENIFWVEVSYSAGILGNRAIRTSLLTSSATPYYYNAGLTNINISRNFDIYADLIQYINSNDIGFMASSNTDHVFPYHRNADYTYNFANILNPLSSTEDLLLYQNDTTPPNHDAGNNYTLNSRYTSPADGHYYFKSNLRVQVSTDYIFPGGGLTPIYHGNIMISFFLYIKKFSSGGVLLETHTENIGANQFYGYVVYNQYSTGNPILGDFIMTGEKMFFLEAGQYVETYFRWVSKPYEEYNNQGIWNGLPTSGRVNIVNGPDTYFKTITTESNGLLTAGNSANYKVKNLEFEAPMSNSDYKSMKLDLSKSLEVNHDGNQNKTAWIRKTERNLATGNMKWQLVSNVNNT